MMVAICAEAPQVCEQIGCPLCSPVACIYTEYADAATTIEQARCDEQGITGYAKAA